MPTPGIEAGPRTCWKSNFTQQSKFSPWMTLSDGSYLNQQVPCQISSSTRALRSQIAKFFTLGRFISWNRISNNSSSTCVSTTTNGRLCTSGILTENLDILSTLIAHCKLVAGGTDVSWWHERLGHAFYVEIKRMYSKNTETGLQSRIFLHARFALLVQWVNRLD